MAAILRQYHHLVRYAHWAYKNDDGAEFRSVAVDLRGDVQHRKLVIVTPFLKHFLRALTPNTHVHLGIRGRDTLVLAFRGTDFPFTVENLVNPQRWWGFWGNCVIDFGFRMSPLTWLSDEITASADGPVMVHDGFLDAFNNLIEDDGNNNNRLRSNILDLLGGAPPSKIEVCGHSLGAALATICAVWCRTQWPDADITCLTLGSPRVGNAAFRQCFAACRIRCARLVVDGDPVPTVPDRFTQAIPGKLPVAGAAGGGERYVHVGTPVLLREAGAGVPANSAEFGADCAEVLAEETAPPLSRRYALPYALGGFLPYWVVRGLRMAPRLWLHHDPNGYETVVQRILEEAGAQDGDGEAVDPANALRPA